MTKKQKKKKVNHLNIKECEEILARLKGQENSLYFQHVLHHYRLLLPDMGSAAALSKTQADGVTFRSSILKDK